MGGVQEGFVQCPEKNFEVDAEIFLSAKVGQENGSVCLAPRRILTCQTSRRANESEERVGFERR
jgi:hypothetical protein